MKKYKVVLRFYETTVDSAFKIRKHVDIKSDLSWDEAKILARETGGEIVPVPQVRTFIGDIIESFRTIEQVAV